MCRSSILIKICHQLLSEVRKAAVGVAKNEEMSKQDDTMYNVIIHLIFIN
jgi:hypothetical protein